MKMNDFRIATSLTPNFWSKTNKGHHTGKQKHIQHTVG